MSAHLILTDDSHMLGNYALNDYDGELLTMAHDLAIRLLPAFNGTKTGKFMSYHSHSLGG